MGARVVRVAETFAAKFEIVINLKTAKALGLTVPSRSSCGPIRSSSDGPPLPPAPRHAVDMLLLLAGVIVWFVISAAITELAP